MAWFRPDARCRNDSEVTLSRYASPRNRAIGRGAISDLGVRAGTCEALEQSRRAARRFPTGCQPKRRGDALLRKCRGKADSSFRSGSDELQFFRKLCSRAITGKKSTLLLAAERHQRLLLRLPLELLHPFLHVVFSWRVRRRQIRV